VTRIAGAITVGETLTLAVTPTCRQGLK